MEGLGERPCPVPRGNARLRFSGTPIMNEMWCYAFSCWIRDVFCHAFRHFAVLAGRKKTSSQSTVVWHHFEKERFSICDLRARHHRGPLIRRQPAKDGFTKMVFLVRRHTHTHTHTRTHTCARSLSLSLSLSLSHTHTHTSLRLRVRRNACVRKGEGRWSHATP